MRHNYALLDNRSFASDPRLKYVKPSWKEYWLRMTKEAGTWPGDEAAKDRKQEEELLEDAKSGRGNLASTDNADPTLSPGFSLHDELALLVEAGLTPTEALQTATINPARFLGRLSSFGTIAEGRFADLVLLDANPLENISNTKKIAAVIFDGVIYGERISTACWLMLQRRPVESENVFDSTAMYYIGMQRTRTTAAFSR